MYPSPPQRVLALGYIFNCFVNSPWRIYPLILCAIFLCPVILLESTTSYGSKFHVLIRCCVKKYFLLFVLDRLPNIFIKCPPFCFYYEMKQQLPIHFFFIIPGFIDHYHIASLLSDLQAEETKPFLVSIQREVILCPDQLCCYFMYHF